jgi:two-component system cell cycle sensor histidine kinase/response regulator CckA
MTWGMRERADAGEGPVDARVPERRSAPSFSALAVQGPLARVLVVEDEALVALDLEQSLTSLGFEVVKTVDTMEEALAAANAYPIDLVLMDIHLRGGDDGVTVATAIRASHDVPVVFLTAYGDEHTLSRALETSPYGYLLKPVEERTLLATIRTALRRHKDGQRAAWIQKAFDLTPVAFVVLDAEAPGRPVLHLNRAMRTLLWAGERSPEGVRFELPVWDPDDVGWQHIQAAIAANENATAVVRCRDVGGAPKWVSVAVGVVLGDDGAARWLTVVTTDVTSEWVSELELTHGNRVREVEKSLQRILPRITGFIDQVLHVSGFAERQLRAGTALEGGALGPLRTDLQALRRSGTPVRVLAERLQLLLQAQESLDASDVIDAQETLRTARPLLARIGKHEQHIDIRLGSAAAPVRITRASLEHVVHELVANAVEACRPDGRITVVSEVPREASASFEAGAFLRVEVVDNGRGMDAEALQNAFALRADEHATGRLEGLGLFTCQRIIHRAGGTIRLQSEVGLGTKATIEVPLAATLENSVTAPRQAVVSLEGQSALVVEHDLRTRMIITRALESQGLNVVGLATAELALQRLRDSNASFDLVVIDEGGDPTGTERLLACTLEHNPCTVPVFVARTGAEVLRHSSVVRHVVWRPFGPETLLRTVRHALAEPHTSDATPFPSSFSGVALLPTPTWAPLPDTEIARSFQAAVDAIEMHYQPLVRATSGQLCGYEALLRSRHPTLRGPLDLLNVANQLGAMAFLGHHVRRKIAEDLESHPACLEPIFVNLHPSEFTSALLQEDEPLLPYARRVVLEVTERSRMEATNELQELLHDLRSAGYRVAVDDLGEGYAGLVSLQRLRPEIVKIDMTLVRNVHTSRYQRDLIRALFTFFRDHAQEVVAEGIESLEEATVLVDLGVTILQGYYFGRPAPPFAEPISFTV